MKNKKTYMEMAVIWAQNSKAKRKKVGCLIVKDNRIISDGYNGTPTGLDNCCEEYCNEHIGLITKREVFPLSMSSDFGSTVPGNPIPIPERDLTFWGSLWVRA